MRKHTRSRATKRHAKKQINADQPVIFADHIAELRRRLLIVFLFLLAGATAAYVYRRELLTVILAPLDGQHLVYLTPGGGFAFIFQVSIYAGFIAALPPFVYQLHSFVRPALPEKAQKSVRLITLLASSLIVGGVSYGYFVAVPAAIQFLGTFAEDAVTPNLTASSYLSFFLAYIGGLAVLSLIPLLVMFWHWINPQTPRQILKSEQYVLVGAFVLAAIITPTPDALNQAMIALPVIIIYQVGVIAVLIDILRKRRASPQFTTPEITLTAVLTPTSAPLQRTVRQSVKPVDGFSPIRTASPINSLSRPSSHRLSLDGMKQ